MISYIQTSLLMTMLGEMEIKSGKADMAGNVAYVPQEAWIFSGTVQENVLFGADLDIVKYKLTLKACALDKVVPVQQYYYLRNKCESDIAIHALFNPIQYAANSDVDIQEHAYEFF